MDAAQITTIAVALLGAGGGITILIKALIDSRSGKTERIRVSNADMKTQRDDAYELADAERDRATREQRRADAEARNRNRWANYAARLYRLLVERGVPETDIPQSPQMEEA